MEALTCKFATVIAKGFLMDPVSHRAKGIYHLLILVCKSGQFPEAAAEKGHVRADW